MTSPRGAAERRWIQLWRNKRKDMQRDKVTEGWKRDDNYFRIDNMPHHMAGDIGEPNPLGCPRAAPSSPLARFFV